MHLLRHSLAALSGAALAGLLAGCSGGATPTASTGSVPVTAGGATVPANVPVTAGDAPSTATQPQATPKPVATPAAPIDFSALTERFVSLRNQGDRALAAIRGEASSTDLATDKALMAQAATIFGGYARGLRTMPFVGQMHKDAQTLAQMVSSISGTFQQASQVTTWDQLDPLLQTLVDDEDTQLTDTQALEKDLYLPLSTPNPVES